MSMNDPLSDMLTRIRNAGMVKFESIEMPFSKMKVQLARILKEEGYINDFHTIENPEAFNTLKLDLKYDKNGNEVITGLKRISKPGRRVYARYNDIPKVLSGLGISIVSTSKGVFTDKQARAQKVGGEIVCEVW